MRQDNSKARQLTAKEALVRAAALCDKAETCSAEVEAKLSAWGVPPEEASAVLRKLEELGYVDNRRYARAFAHSKMAYSGWGKFKISMALRTKMIERELIAEALDALDSEEYSEAARRAVRAKLRQTGGSAADYNTRMKVMRFAAGRGFEPTLISSILREMAQSEE